MWLDKYQRTNTCHPQVSLVDRPHSLNYIYVHLPHTAHKYAQLIFTNLSDCFVIHNLFQMNTTTFSALFFQFRWCIKPQHLAAGTHHILHSPEWRHCRGSQPPTFLMALQQLLVSPPHLLLPARGFVAPTSSAHRGFYSSTDTIPPGDRCHHFNKRLAWTPTTFRGRCAQGHSDHDQNAPHLHSSTSSLPLDPNSDLLDISLVDFLWYGYDIFQGLYTRLDYLPPQTIHTQQELLQFGNSQT